MNTDLNENLKEEILKLISTPGIEVDDLEITVSRNQ